MEGRRVSPQRAAQRRRIAAIAAVALVAAAIHFAAPTSPHGWHWVHLAAQKLHYVPILLAAVWFGVGGTVAVTAGVSFLFLTHILLDWSGDFGAQADQLADIGNLWLVALLAALLVRRVRASLEETRLAHQETLSALAASLELREEYTAGHSRRATAYALLLADALGADGDLRRDLAIGGLLHDVGKIATPDHILHKAEALDGEDLAELRRHPENGAALIGDIAFLRGARELVLAHHERYDGRGYPHGLGGPAIPRSARIFAVADAFDALTTDRPTTPPRATTRRGSASSRRPARSSIPRSSARSCSSPSSG